MSRSVSVGPLIEMDRPRIRYQESEGVYPVREDTLLLLRSLTEHMEIFRTGHYLDMGCGTGLCSVAAVAAGWDVRSADRNPRALALTRHNLILNGHPSHLLLTDLFSGIPHGHRGHYDLITFNPPYLPTEEKEKTSGWLEKAWQGGPSGRKVIESFLRELPKHLGTRGTVLMVLSSLSEPGETIKVLKEQGFKVNIVCEESLEFESLLVIKAML